jgi:hypothetical protein
VSGPGTDFGYIGLIKVLSQADSTDASEATTLKMARNPKEKGLNIQIRALNCPAEVLSHLIIFWERYFVDSLIAAESLALMYAVAERLAVTSEPR